MKPTRMYSMLLAAAALLLTPAAALAVPLADLFQGQTITADDKLFTNWALVTNEVNDGIINLAMIDVTPLVDDPLNPGIKFTAPVDALGTLFGHPPGAFARLRFSFQVQTTNQLPLIKDNSLLINNFLFDSTPDATITITETVRDVLGTTLGVKDVLVRPSDTPGTGNPNHFDSLNFTPPRSVLLVEKFIEVLGPNTNDGARVLMFEQRFSQVPEPSAAFMALAAGVLALVARRLC